MAIRARASSGDAAASLPEHGARRSSGGCRRRNDGVKPDRQGLLAAKPIFDWHAAHEDLYVGQQNAGRVLLRGDGQHGGLSRLLQAADRAAHPVRGDRKRSMGGRTSVRRFDLVIVPGRMPGARPVSCATVDGCSWRGDTAAAAGWQRRRPAHDAGLLADSRSRNVAVAAGHRSDLSRRRLRRTDTDRAAAPHAAFLRRCSVRPRKSGATRSRRGCQASCSATTSMGASRTCRGMSEVSTIGRARQDHAGLVADVIDRLLP